VIRTGAEPASRRPQQALRKLERIRHYRRKPLNRRHFPSDVTVERLRSFVIGGAHIGASGWLDITAARQSWRYGGASRTWHRGSVAVLLEESSIR